MRKQAHNDAFEEALACGLDEGLRVEELFVEVKGGLDVEDSVDLGAEELFEDLEPEAAPEGEGALELDEGLEGRGEGGVFGDEG